jgi:hypothetical protein
MFNPETKTVWYGLLQTKSENIPVVYDPKLPEAPKKQMYLYNATKDAIVCYVKEIVEPKLIEFDSEEERSRAEKELKTKWKAASKAFIKERGGPVLTNTVAAPSKPVKKQELEAEALDGVESVDGELDEGEWDEEL